MPSGSIPQSELSELQIVVKGDLWPVSHLSRFCETFDELVYRDTNVNIDVFGPQNAASFVQRWESTGDTRGEDAGVKTGEQHRA